MNSLQELINILEKQYPNDILTLKDTSETTVAVVIAQLEMIDYIKQLANIKGKR
jgi:hypothetical protein